MISLDLSTLSSYYASGLSLQRSILVGALRAEGIERALRDDPAVIPPWQVPDQVPEDRLLERLFSAAPKLATDAALAAGGDEGLGELFALWRGLSRLQELAQYAESGARADSLRSLLDHRFRSYLDEVRKFAGALQLRDITVLAGVERKSIETTTPIPKPIEKTLPEHIGAVLTSARGDAIPGLAGTETFTIELVTSTGTTNVAIDLANVVGTLNVDNVSAYINSELETTGALTRLMVERFHESAYGFRLQMSSAETVTFLADAGSESPALFLAGAAGGGEAGTGFVQKLDNLGAAAPVEGFRSEIATDQTDNAQGVAVDSFGNVYVVGTTAGDLDGLANHSTPDAYLRKFDAAGNLLWSRLLGATETAAGTAVVVDGNDNVIVAGQVRGLLTDTAHGGGADSFVTKYDANGRELWTQQAAPIADDSALALAVNAAGEIFVAGQTRAALDSSVTHGGGADAYVSKLDADGNRLYVKQFGGAGEDRVTAIQIDAAGDILVAAEVGGQAVLRKYADEAASQTPTYEVDLGALGAGGVTGLALGDGGAVYLSGHTDNTALTGTVAQAHAGGIDGFVTRLIDSGASAAIDWVSYLGGSGEDRALGLTVKADATGDEIYLSGSTTSALAAGGLVGAVDGFAAKLDATGTTLWAHQFGSAFAHSARAITYDATATSVITQLGLPTTPLPIAAPGEVINLTNARAGQSFEIPFDGGAFRRVTIEDGDSFTYLAFKIKLILGQSGTARYESNIGSMRLRIEAGAGSRIELRAGPEGRDALAALGLAPVTIFNGEAAVGETAEDEVEHRVFALGLFEGMSLDGTRASQEAGLVIKDAMRQIREIHDRLTGVAESNPLAALAALAIPPAEQARIDAMRTALLRLIALNTNNTSSFSLTI